MNHIIGRVGAVINSVSVVAFAICMLLKWNTGSYFVCMFIAFSFVLIISAICQECPEDKKAAGYSALVFAGIYATIILLVYYTQLTTVRLDDLNQQATQILDYQKYGLFFGFDLLGYGVMALSTFSAGFAIASDTKINRWLKRLLFIHGMFFLPCLIVPMLGVFSDTKSSYWTGVVLLEIWCVYFLSVGILSWLHFKNEK